MQRQILLFQSLYLVSHLYAQPLNETSVDRIETSSEGMT